ncbi:MAG TPA: glycosyltransferase family 2 protein [Syntrophorhabdaceae bacterium]|nr:glycosyltransferase family 2 protein [Syntrophorhabdaceae bacterium]HOD74626.1 glycosyltransferase family 2 protein [Syntrophorhabdaceae bacterium]
MKEQPLVSIIVPAYNYGTYVHRAIGSCLRQSSGNLEVIVIDDGSTDATGEIVRKIADQRVVYHYQENQGVSAARNKGLRMAKGDFIAFLDADDYLTDDSVETRVTVMLENPDIDFVTTTASSVDDAGRVSFRPYRGPRDIVSRELCQALLLKRIPYTTSAVLVRGSHARKFEFATDLNNGEDLVFFSKVFFDRKGCFLSKPTAVTFSHPDSLRHNIANLRTQGAGLIEAIFDDPYFAGRLEHIRRPFAANRYVELFRRFYRSGDDKLAREYYRKALALEPSRIFKIDHLFKFIRTWF